MDHEDRSFFWGWKFQLLYLTLAIWLMVMSFFVGTEPTEIIPFDYPAHKLLRGASGLCLCIMVSPWVARGLGLGPKGQ